MAKKRKITQRVYESGRETTVVSKAKRPKTKKIIDNAGSRPAKKSPPKPPPDYKRSPIAAQRSFPSRDEKKSSQLLYKIPDHKKFTENYELPSDYNTTQLTLLIKDPYWMAKYPVTKELLLLFDSHHAKRFDDYAQYSKKPRCPAIYANCFDAWCAAIWLHARLPDEYEWERACRGTQGTKIRYVFWYGNDEEELEKYAWYDRKGGNHSHAVDERNFFRKLVKQPNDFGLFHMHGTVWEWTGSYYATDPRQGRDATYVGASRVLRGGSWGSDAHYCRCAGRDRGTPERSSYVTGFRVCRGVISS